MKIQRLGRSDLHVSELCFGTANLGWRIDEEAAFAMLDLFRASGGNFLQTRSAAADDSEVAESYLGRWIRSRGVPRGEIVVASRHDLVTDGESGDVFRTASVIRRRCENSLRRLKLRYLDLLVLEWSDRHALDEVILAAETLVRAGLIRHFAVSGFPTWRVMEWIAHSARRNLCRLEALQVGLSLVSNAGVNLEAMALARSHRVGLVARAPFGGGLLSGRSLSGRTNSPAATETLDEVRQIAKAHGTEPGGVALAWVLAHLDVSSVLIGPHSLAGLKEHIAATSLGLSFSELRRLDWRWRTTVGSSCDDEEEEESCKTGSNTRETIHSQHSEKLDV